MMHVVRRPSCKRCKRYRQIIKRRRRKARQESIINEEHMLLVVDDAFDAPTIKYLIRCVEEGLLELQTKSLALSSELKMGRSTSLATSQMVEAHLHETSIDSKRLKKVRLAIRVHTPLRSIIGNISTSQFYASMRAIVQNPPLQSIHTVACSSTHAIATCSPSSQEDFLPAVDLDYVKMAGIATVQVLVSGRSSDDIIQWTRHMLGAARSFPPYMFREVDQTYRRRTGFLHSPMILATYSAYLSQQPYAYPPEQDWEGLITSVYAVHLSLSLYSRGHKGDEGTYFPRNWGDCRNRQRFRIASVIKLLTTVGFQKIVDSARVINILPCIPRMPANLHFAARTAPCMPSELYNVAWATARANFHSGVTGVDAVGASTSEDNEYTDEDGPYISDDAYDRFGHQKPQNAYSEDLPDGWKHLAIGRHDSQDLPDGWRDLAA
ncbi:hypothetical protein PC9H_011252 [Pleurotus ostreatus]|uniref:Uncharacterized protein n=1 Tax=Pleurotus ostreatus TaxID=5322 RepID=A0A8H7DP41_PLEOS|nr:uncharacterized protein PC9H_011252 [Pleurotus ostreatus]KAF7420734.1 hypothetical protein PC9H_011252 [Pleurotus ostreatus]